MIATKIHVKLALPFDADGSKHVVVDTGDVETRERRGEADAVVREEHLARGECVAAADCVACADAFLEPRDVVAPAIGVLEELAAVVQVEAGAEAVPAWEPPVGIGSACRACIWRRGLAGWRCCGRGEGALGAPMAMKPLISRMRIS